MRIIITAGSTREPIDEVRCITNSSTGSLGVKIAQEFLKQREDAEIFFIHGKGSLTPAPQDKRVHLIPVSSTSNLLDTLCTLQTPDIVVHSMAVSDYTVDKIFDYNTDKDIPRGGKISSSLENPCILLKPTSKVIGHIKKMWPHTFLVGFKLLDQVSQDELFDTAFSLLRKNRCNLVLANDISEIRAGNHNGMLVFPEKTKTLFHGKQDIAENLVKTILIRQAVHHHRSILTNANTKDIERTLKSKIAPYPYYSSFYETGNWLWNHFFLPSVPNENGEQGTYGNMSLRLGNNDFIMTGRNVNKGSLYLEDLVYISEYKKLDPTQAIVGEVHYTGMVKPSIDAPIHAEIYKMLPNVKAMIHVHTNINFKNIPSTTYNFPCGCEEEVQELVKLIRENQESSILQMVNHGLLIMGDSLEDCQEKLNHFYQENLPFEDLCFHATYAANIPSILEQGLILGMHPNWDGSDDSALIYLVSGSDDASEIALSFCEAADNVPSEIYNSGIVVLAVPKNELHDVYSDPNIILPDEDEEDEVPSYMAVSEPISADKLIFFQSYQD